MEFFEGAQEMRHAQVDDRVIDDALRVVRRMWDAGVAHRDIKPSNILVRDEHVLLIDVAFASGAADPLAPGGGPGQHDAHPGPGQHPRARLPSGHCGVFAADDVAEAFAASRSITIPSQLRSLIRADGRDLIRRFRQLAPKRRPIPVQLWDIRRAGVTAGLITVLAAAVARTAATVRVAGLL